MDGGLSSQFGQLERRARCDGRSMGRPRTDLALQTRLRFTSGALVYGLQLEDFLLDRGDVLVEFTLHDVHAGTAHDRTGHSLYRHVQRDRPFLLDVSHEPNLVKFEKLRGFFDKVKPHARNPEVMQVMQ
jgi:hypothetical protein